MNSKPKIQGLSPRRLSLPLPVLPYAPFPSFPILNPFLSLPLHFLPLIMARETGTALHLPQRIRAEPPGRQAHFGAIHSPKFDAANLLLSHEFYQPVFTMHRNARIASAVLAIAIPSVCLSICLSVHPSVTCRYCVKTTAQPLPPEILAPSDLPRPEGSEF